MLRLFQHTHPTNKKDGFISNFSRTVGRKITPFSFQLDTKFNPWHNFRKHFFFRLSLGAGSFHRCRKFSTEATISVSSKLGFRHRIYCTP